MSKKYRTIEQVETAQERAVRFAQNVLLDEDKADELSSLSPEEYAERKRIQIITPNPNPNERNRPIMPKPTRAELEQRVQELEDENSDLNERLDAIADLVGTADEDTESDDDDQESDDDDESDDEQ